MIRASRLTLAAVVAAAALAPAQAVEVSRTDLEGASGMCKTTLPADAAKARYRPLGLANESSSAMRVACNWQGDDSQNSERGARRVFVVVSNNGTSTRSVSCTLVNGYQSGVSVFATYTPKTASIAAGAGATIQWVPGDVAGDPETIMLPSLVCILPANSTLQYTGKVYNEDVGA